MASFPSSEAHQPIAAARLLAWAFAPVLCVVLLLAPAVRAQDAPIPALTARVTDTAGLLAPDQRSALETTLADYEAKKGTQIAVLTVPTTAPEAIEQYGIRVAEAWKIGRKGTADGVILIVAKDNPPALRRLRIEVGRGLEGAIPDADAKRIVDEDIAPHFRQGDYYGGLAAGVSRIEGLLSGEALPPPVVRTQPSSSLDHGGGSPLWFLLLFFVLPLVIRMFSARRVGYAGGSRALNGSFGSFVTGAVLGGLTSRGGGFGGGGFGGGGGGGGGFSGGGGDFGGGGASGNW